MTILQVSPDAPALVRSAADAILFLHIGGGSVGLISGATALLSRKGERLHRMAGNVFFVSMLVMATIGAAVSPFLPERASAVAGLLTFYLVATSWVTVKRKEGTIGRAEIAGLFLALGVIAGAAIMIAQAGNTGRLDGQPVQALYLFGLVALIAAAGDLRMILRGGIAGSPRIARHLWRMCAPLFIASMSFLAQQKILPAFMRGSPLLLIPAFAPLVLMIFWLIRVRFTNRMPGAAIGPA